MVTRRGFIGTMLAVVAVPRAVLAKPKPALAFHPDAFKMVWPIEDISLAEYQRRYNYAVSQVAEQLALAPKAPWVALAGRRYEIGEVFTIDGYMTVNPERR
jgi:hypothetical protein